MYNKFRCFLLKGSGVEIGQGSRISPNSMILKGVKLGKNVEVRDYTKLEEVTIADNSVVDIGALLLGVENIKFSIGEETYIGFYAVLDGSGALVIGNNVHIASPSVGIWTHTSVFQALTGAKLKDPALRKVSPVKIEDNVWIGGNSIIYPGVTIGHHSVILPNSSINKDIPPNSMVGGSPAKIIKKVTVSKNNVDFISNLKE